MIRLFGISLVASCVLLAAGQACADPPAGALRVMAYNIKHGRGMDNRVDLKRAAEVINRVRPDLVALQEIDENVPRSGSIDQAAELGKLTEMHHAFGSFFDFMGGRYGMAILSREPLRSVTNHRLPDGAEPRTALAAVVQPVTGGPEIVFVSVHFYRTEAERLAQADTLLEALAKEERPVIVAGDFNSQPDSPVMARFAEWKIPGKGENRFTVPSDRPRAEIDFIIFRPASAFTSGRVDVLDEPLVSDHRPLVLDLRLSP